VYGYDSKDVVRLEESTGLVKRFILTDKEEGLSGFNCDAVMGLGIDKLYPSLVEELYEQKKINSPRFSIYLSEKESRVLLGDYSQSPVLSSTYRQMTFCNAHNAWKCEANKFEVNKKSIPIESYALIDTTSHLLKIPISDYKIFKKYILEPNNSICQINSNQLACKCEKPNKFPDFSLFINNSPIVISTEKIIDYYPNLEFQCVFQILIDNDNLDTWILGTNVLQDILFSFDTLSKKIGFVQSPTNFRSLILKQEIYEEIGTDSPSDKLIWLFVMIFVMLCMYGLVRFANGDYKLFDRSESINIDKFKMELIQNKFNSEEYDYDKNFKKDELKKNNI
jgi:hypothetical protein